MLKNRYLKRKSVLIFKEKNKKNSVFLKKTQVELNGFFSLEEIKSLIEENIRIGIKAYLIFCQNRKNNTECIELYNTIKNRWDKLFYKEKFGIGEILMNINCFSEALKIFFEIIENCKNENLLLIKYIENYTFDDISCYVLNVINILLKKRIKQPLDMYRIASLYKKISKLNSSKKWFKRVLKETKDPHLISGVYFHLGEIAFWERKENKAKKYFMECIKLNKKHKKAKEYLNEENINYS